MCEPSFGFVLFVNLALDFFFCEPSFGFVLFVNLALDLFYL